MSIFTYDLEDRQQRTLAEQNNSGLEVLIRHDWNSNGLDEPNYFTPLQISNSTGKVLLVRGHEKQTR